MILPTRLFLARSRRFECHMCVYTIHTVLAIILYKQVQGDCHYTAIISGGVTGAITRWPNAGYCRVMPESLWIIPLHSPAGSLQKNEILHEKFKESMKTVIMSSTGVVSLCQAKFRNYFSFTDHAVSDSALLTNLHRNRPEAGVIAHPGSTVVPAYNTKHHSASGLCKSNQ